MLNSLFSRVSVIASISVIISVYVKSQIDSYQVFAVFNVVYKSILKYPLGF